jgi:beta-barrel assembly-enhancing protease
MTNRVFILLLVCLLLNSCKTTSDVKVLTISEEISLGRLIRDDIIANTGTFLVLPINQYPESTRSLRSIRDKVLNGNTFNYKNVFTYDTFIIRDDNNLMCFVLPGGHFFISTGLLKQLTSEDQLAALISYELNLADQRLVSDFWVRKYGVNLIQNSSTGSNASFITELSKITAGLSSTILSFESSVTDNSDNLTTSYLINSKYSCNSLLSVFDVLAQSNKVNLWSQNQPISDSRRAKIQTSISEKSCSTSINSNQTDFTLLKSKLP